MIVYRRVKLRYLSRIAVAVFFDSSVMTTLLHNTLCANDIVSCQPQTSPEGPVLRFGTLSRTDIATGDPDRFLFIIIAFSIVNIRRSRRVYKTTRNSPVGICENSDRRVPRSTMLDRKIYGILVFGIGEISIIGTVIGKISVEKWRRALSKKTLLHMSVFLYPSFGAIRGSPEENIG